MKNAKVRLKNAIKKTTQFMLNIEVYSSARIPDWYDQLALSSTHNGLNNSIYETLLEKLSINLNKEYGSSAAKFLLS